MPSVRTNKQKAKSKSDSGTESNNLKAIGTDSELSTGELARKSVYGACVGNSHFVKTIALEPLTTVPGDLSNLSLQQIGITDMEAFKKMLMTFLPYDLNDEVKEMNINPAVIIGLIVNYVEDLIQSSRDTDEREAL